MVEPITAAYRFKVIARLENAYQQDSGPYVRYGPEYGKSHLFEIPLKHELGGGEHLAPFTATVKWARHFYESHVQRVQQTGYLNNGVLKCKS